MPIWVHYRFWRNCTGFTLAIQLSVCLSKHTFSPNNNAFFQKLLNVFTKWINYTVSSFPWLLIKLQSWENSQQLKLCGMFVCEICEISEYRNKVFKSELFLLLLMNDDAQKDLHSSPGLALMCWFSNWNQLITSVTGNVTDFLSSKLRIDKCEWNELKYSLKDDKNQWKVYENHCSVLTFFKIWILIRHSGQLLLLDIKWLSLLSLLLWWKW